MLLNVFMENKILLTSAHGSLNSTIEINAILNISHYILNYGSITENYTSCCYLNDNHTGLLCKWINLCNRELLSFVYESLSTLFRSVNRREAAIRRTKKQQNELGVFEFWFMHTHSPGFNQKIFFFEFMNEVLNDWIF